MRVCIEYELVKGGEKMKIKNLLIILAALVFGFSVVLVSARKVSQSQVLGESEVVEEESMAVAESEDEKGVDYYLPYPGILPDHPLYWLKMIRDRVILWLTHDPVAKFDRLLLYADKRLGAAEVLIKGGKKELGVTTATKGEKYLERAVTQFKQLKNQKKVTPELIDRLKRATLKHKEVLEGVLEKVPDQAKPVIQQAMEKSKHGYETLMQIMEKSKEGKKEQMEEEKEEGQEESNTEGGEDTEEVKGEETSLEETEDVEKEMEELEMEEEESEE